MPQGHDIALQSDQHHPRVHLPGLRTASAVQIIRNVVHELCLQYELFLETFLPTAPRENANLMPMLGPMFVRLPDHVLLCIGENLAGYVWCDELRDLSSDEDERRELQSYVAEVGVERTTGFGRGVPLFLKHIENHFDGPFENKDEGSDLRYAPSKVTL